MAKMVTQKAAPGLGIDADLARKLLYDMVLIRRFEEKAAEAYTLGKVGGFLHLYIGQEAVAVGASSADGASWTPLYHALEETGGDVCLAANKYFAGMNAGLIASGREYCSEVLDKMRHYGASASAAGHIR